MKIAIMGAGLSGLCCAITLKKQGLDPVVFEKRNQVGDRFVNGEVMLSLLIRPLIDHVAYLSDHYGIYIQPAANIRRMTVISEKQRGSIRGNLGFITIRGRREDSLEMQLARQYEGRIYFNSTASYEELQQEFTHVVMATGDAAYAARIQDIQLDLTVTLKGATVQGQFDHYQVLVWLNNRFAPQGYGYLIPYSENEANLVIGYPDYPRNRRRDLSRMWEYFLGLAQYDLKQTLRITDQFEVTRYIIGKSRYPRIGNTFFTGNCLCTPMPALGFGQFDAMLSGIYAAQHLLGHGDYSHLTTQLRRDYGRSLILRRVLERMSNRDYDLLVRLVRTPIANQILNTPWINAMSIASLLSRPWADNTR